MAVKRRYWGTGHVRLRADGRWEARFWDWGGKQISLYGHSRAHVEAKLAVALERKSQGYQFTTTRIRPKPNRPNLPTAMRFRVLKRCGFACTYCGRKAPEVQLHIDHIIPLSKGGTNDKDNLTAACAECNIGKGAQAA